MTLDGQRASRVKAGHPVVGHDHLTGLKVLTGAADFRRPATFCCWDSAI